MFARATLLRAPAAGLALGLLVLLAFSSPAEAASTPASRWRYRSNADLAAAMDALHAGPCSGMSSLVSIGTSVKGTEIRVLEVSADPGRTQAKPSFLFLGNMHGDEPVGRELILRLAELICVAASASGDADTKNADGVITVVEQGDEHFHEAARSLATTSRLFFVPSINPDGFENRARNNARGVDLNRDWPDQFVSFATGGTDEGSGGSTTKGSGGNNEGATTSIHGDSTTSTTFGSSTVLSETGGGWMADLPHKRQPETAALMKLSRTLNATAGLNFHEGAVVANYPWDAKDGSTKVRVAFPKSQYCLPIHD
jgi:carboxypeptidase D